MGVAKLSMLVNIEREGWATVVAPPKSEVQTHRQKTCCRLAHTGWRAETPRDTTHILSFFPPSPLSSLNFVYTAGEDLMEIAGRWTTTTFSCAVLRHTV